MSDYGSGVFVFQRTFPLISLNMKKIPSSFLQVCHSKSGEVNSTKVANLVKAYVDKYKYSRKGNQKKTLEEPMSADKNMC